MDINVMSCDFFILVLLFSIVGCDCDVFILIFPSVIDGTNAGGRASELLRPPGNESKTDKRLRSAHPLVLSAQVRSLLNLFEPF